MDISHFETTTIRLTQADGTETELPGYVSPNGSISIFLPPDCIESYNALIEAPPPDTEADSVQTVGDVLSTKEINENSHRKAEPLYDEIVVLEDAAPENDIKTIIVTNALRTNHNAKSCEKCHVSYRGSHNCSDNGDDEHSKRHVCVKCGEGYNFKKNLTLHEASHAEDLTCPECSKSFNRVAAFKAHLSFHEEDDSLTCPDCGEEFELTSQLDKHSKLFHDENPTVENVFPCTFCPKIFSSLTRLENHKRDHDRVQSTLLKRRKKKKMNLKRKDLRQCQTCGKRFYRPSQLERHILVHTGEKPFKCPICSAAFSQKGSLKVHLCSHAGFKPHACQFCGQTFGQRGNLKAHIDKLHKVPRLGGKQFSCPCCSCLFPSTSSLHCHITRFHNVRGSACTVEIDNLDILQKALQESGLPAEVDTENIKKDPEVANITEPGPDGKMKYYAVVVKDDKSGRVYVCEFCKREFRKPSDLIRHFRVHTGERPYKCDICSKAFSSKSSLNNHLLSHNNPILYECKECNKKFRTAPGYYNHIRMHRNPKIRRSCKEFIDVVKNSTLQQRPHECSICKFRYSKKSHLKQHMMSHTGDRPFTCNVCSKKFSKYAILKAHIKTHFGIRPYSCHVCLQTFTTRGSVKRHFEAKHSNDAPYGCPICPSGFRTSTQCKAHIRKHKRLDGQPLVLYVPESESKTAKNLLPPTIELNKEDTDLPLGIEESLQIDPCFLPSSTPATEAIETPEPLDLPSLSPPNIQELAQTLSEELFDNNEVVVGEELFDNNEVVVGEELFDNNEAVESVQLFDNNEVVVSEQLFDSNEVVDSEQLFDNNEVVECEQLFDSNEVVESEQLFDGNEVVESEQLFNGNEVVESEQLFDGNEVVESEQLFDNNEGVQDVADNIENCLLQANLEVGDIVASEEFTTTIELAEAADIFSIGPDQSINFFPVMTLEEVTIEDIPLDVEADSEPKRKCNTCDFTADTDRDILRHMKDDHVTDTKPRIKRPKGRIKQLTDEENARVASRCFDKTASVSEAVLAAAAAEKLGKIDSRRKGTKKKNAVCETCNRAFSRASDLTRHERTHTGEKPFACDLCERKFSVKCTLVSHMRTHSIRSQLICHICNSAFSYKSSLKVHMRLHTGARPFHCTLCPSSFRTSGHLKNHTMSHFVPPVRPWANDPFTIIDNYVYPSSPKVQNDLNCQLDEKENFASQDSSTVLDESLVGLPEECVTELLNEQPSFITAEDLEDYELKPPPAAPPTPPSPPSPPLLIEKKKKGKSVYTCNTCSKTFTKPSLLKRHEYAHSGVRPFACRQCDKSFNQKHVLDEHIKAHEGHRDFKCTYCSFSSIQKSNLKTHISRCHQFAHFDSDNLKGDAKTKELEYEVARIAESIENNERELNLNIADVEQVMDHLFA